MVVGTEARDKETGELIFKLVTNITKPVTMQAIIIRTAKPKKNSRIVI